VKGVILLVAVSAALPLVTAELAGATRSAAVNVVTEGVTPIRRSGEATDPAVLLVYVVDPDSVPLEGVDVRLIFARGSKGTGKTGKDGTCLLRSAEVGRLVVRASLGGHVPAEARNVVLRRNGLTAIALALEPERPK
jgi:hypothetical protein